MIQNFESTPEGDFLCEILRCPFCNRSDVVIEPIGLFGQPAVRCRTCNAKGPPSMTEKGAVDWWNTREDKQ